MSIEYCEKHNQRFDTDIEDACPRCEAIRFDLTNAPPLPDEPKKGADGMWSAPFGRCLDPLTAYGAYAAELRTIATTLRAQLEQSPMRESAIIKGLERQLAEARVEIERLTTQVASEYMRGRDHEQSAKMVADYSWRDRALEQTARADACEKDAGRYRWLRDNGADTVFMKNEVSFMSKDRLIYVKQIGWTELDTAIDAALGAPT